MTDIHCHILPGVDDGAADLTDSISMARLAQQCGVSTIVATPHFRGEPAALGGLTKVLSRYKLLTGALAKAGIDVTIYPGAEILCLPETAEMARQKRLPTMGNTNCLLTEFFFDESPEYMAGALEQINDAGYRTVIAHPERYECVQRAPGIVGEWFQRGYFIQLNKGSILGAFGRKPQQTAQWILDGGLAHMVASDAHSSFRRTTDLTPVVEELTAHYPKEYVRVLLEENPSRLIHGKALVSAE